VLPEAVGSTDMCSAMKLMTNVCQRLLPPLTTAATVRELTLGQLDAYLDGYNIRDAAGLDEAEKRRLLFHFLGCTSITE
jgi:hypothetical protein